MQIEMKNITKEYNKGIKALDDINITLTPGIYGLLGPNGAGKTTLINILTDNLKETSGEIIMDGKPIKEMGAGYRKKLGYMPQQQGIYPGFTFERFMYYMAALKGLTKAEADEQIPRLIDKVNLGKFRKKKVGSFSGGMKQRALLAQALLGNPEIVILDEPTAGLDPKERIRIRNLISEIAIDKIVLIATHVVQDVEFIAKAIIILNKGKLIKVETPAKLIDELYGMVYEQTCYEKDVISLSDKYPVSGVTRVGDKVNVRYIGEKGMEGPDINIVIPGLEEVYLSYFDGEEKNEYL